MTDLPIAPPLPQLYEYLRDNSKRAYYFGLGFIQIKVSDTERYHFYSERLPQINEEPHSHRYMFNSTIIKGILRNEDWYTTADPDPHHALLACENGSLMHRSYVSCSPTKPAPDHTKPHVLAYAASVVGHTEGRTYSLDHWMYHKVLPATCDTITHLIRSHPDTHKEFAEVLREPGAGALCPYRAPLDEAELWSIVKAVIES